MAFEVKSCCCGIGVRTGTLILGWIGFMGSILLTLSLFVFVAITKDDVYLPFCPNDGLTVGCEALFYHTMVGVIVAAAFILLGIASLHAMLLWGTHKEKPALILPCLILRSISLIIYGLSALIIMCIAMYIGSVFGIIVSIVKICIVIPLEGYFLCVIAQCYKEMKQINSGTSTDSNISYVLHKEKCAFASEA